MTPEAQRIAIAEACGWRDVVPVKIKRADNVIDFVGIWGIAPQPCATQPWIPDYLSDLNAVHEAEKVIPADRRQTYHRYLVLPMSLDWVASRADFEWQATHATAAQRAEAFLRCMGMWDDSK